MLSEQGGSTGEEKTVARVKLEEESRDLDLERGERIMHCLGQPR